MKKKLNRNQASSAIMMRSLLLLVTAIIFATSLVMVIAIGHQVLETSNTKADNIITSLKGTVIDGDRDWKNWRKNSTLDTSTSYVKVSNLRKHADTKYYYSPGTDDLLEIQPKKIPLLPNVYYRKDVGFLSYDTGHYAGIYYQLWTKLDSEVAILERVILVTLIILILTILLSPFYIRYVAQRLTNPLSELTMSAEKISKNPQHSALELPVPQRPTEVTKLANSFNRLLKQLAAQSEKEKLFVSNAAHELRTPIATIRSHAQLIQRRGNDHPEIIPKSINYINDESHQMQALVEQLLTLSRADRLTLDTTQYNLSQALTTTIAKVQPVTKQKIKVNIADHLFVKAQAETVEQIVLNLINNASKYSPEDSEIQVTLAQSNQQLILSVADQGVGIKAADKEHIFERFYRSDEIRGAIAGTGLGLAIAQTLADLNHAQLKVADNQPQGSIFKLIFETTQLNN